MALKDWKKQKNMNYGWKNGNKLVRVYTTGGNYNVHIPYLSFEPEFKTKQQALAFAKAYMRTH